MPEQNTRRNFLKFSTLAGLGITVNPLSAFSATTKESESNKAETTTPVKHG